MVGKQGERKCQSRGWPNCNWKLLSSCLALLLQNPYPVAKTHFINFSDFFLLCNANVSMQFLVSAKYYTAWNHHCSKTLLHGSPTALVLCFSLLWWFPTRHRFYPLHLHFQVIAFPSLSSFQNMFRLRQLDF